MGSPFERADHKDQGAFPISLRRKTSVVGVLGDQQPVGGEGFPDQRCPGLGRQHEGGRDITVSGPEGRRGQWTLDWRV